jgi:flavorubredoxin
MASITLFESANHRNVLLDQSTAGDTAVQANQHLITHEHGGIVLDPGGHKVYSKVLAETLARAVERDLIPQARLLRFRQQACGSTRDRAP